MKTILRTALGAVTTVMALAFTACDTDNATEITYGVYASPDLLALTTPQVTVTSSSGATETQTLDAKDFKVSSDLNITAGDQGLVFWSTRRHFDKFGVESSLTVTFVPKPGVDLTALSGKILLAHGLLGNVLTQDKDGDWYDKPIYRPEQAEVFTLPDDAGAARTYLIDLSNTPQTVTVRVDNSGQPVVEFK